MIKDEKVKMITAQCALINTLACGPKPLKWLWVLNVYVFLERIPKSLVAFLWPGQQQVIYINSEKHALLFKPEAARVPIHRLSTNVCHNFGEVCLLVTTTLGVPVQGFLQDAQGSFEPFLVP